MVYTICLSPAQAINNKACNADQLALINRLVSEKDTQENNER